MYKELDTIVLQENIANEHLQKGDVGTIVAVYADGKGFEVEFVTYSGETVALVTLKPNQIRQIRKNEISHVRELDDMLVA